MTRNDNIQANAECYTLMFQGLRNNRKFKDAIKTFEQARRYKVQFTARQYLPLLHSFFILGRLDELLEDMRKEKIHLETRHYEEMIRACQQTGDTAQALSYLQQMESEGLKVINHYIPKSLLHVCRNGSDIRSAIQVVHRFRPLLNTDCYNLFLNILAEREEYLSQVESLVEFLEAGPGASVETYDGLCKAYAQCGDVDRVEHLVHSKLTSARLVHLVTALAKAGQYQRIIPSLTRFGAGNEPKVVHNALNRLFDAGEMELLDELFLQYGKKITTFEFPGLYDWDVHGFGLGVAVACVRHGLHSIDPGLYGTIVTGFGKHQSQGRSIRDHLLANPCILGDVAVYQHAENDGVLIVHKQPDFAS